MSTEAKTIKRIYKIRKQTFRQQIKGNREWIVNVEGHDQHGVELHQWRMKIGFTNFSGYYFESFSGFAINSDVVYERFYCELDIYVKGKDKITIRKENVIDPMFTGFDLPYAYFFGTNPNTTEMDLFITIASSNERKSQDIEPQKEMLDQAILTDIVIKTKEQEFPCHKVILAAESEYFRTMFQSDMKEKRTSMVEWTDVFEASVVKDLLHFIYTGQTPPNIEKNKFELLEAAHLCQLTRLKVICAHTIGEGIDVANAGRVLETAEIYELDDLKTVALKFVATNSEQVLDSGAYQEIDGDVKARLLDSVLKVFNHKETTTEVK